MDDRWDRRAQQLERSLQDTSQISEANKTSLQSEAIALRNEANDNAIPSYERRKRLQTLERLSNLLAALDKPPEAPKFSFKGRAGFKQPSAPTIEAIEQPTCALSPIVPKPTQPTIKLSWLSRPNASTVPLEEDAKLGSSSPSFSRLDSCIVDLRGQGLPALYLTKLEHCVVLAPEVSGSVLLHEVKHCVLIIGAQQLRIHSSCNTVLLLEGSSLVPIIEDCQDVCFGTSNRDRVLHVEDFHAPAKGDRQAWSCLSEADESDLRQHVLAIEMPPSDTSPAAIEQLLSKACPKRTEQQ